MESQSELVGGEQNNQTVQPLVADENDQNVKSKADGKKKAKSPGTDKKCREKKKRKTEATEKQLEESGSKIDKLEKKNAYLNGKLDQAKEDIKLITGARHRVLIRPRETFPFEATRFGTGEIGLPVHSSPVHQIVLTIGLEGLADEDPWWTHLPFETTGFGTGEIGLPAHNPPVHQFGTTTGSGGLAVEHPRGLPQSQLSQGRTNVQQKNHDEYLKADRPLIGVFGDFGDYPNNISLPRAAMASGSSPMQGSLAPGGQARVSLHFLYNYLHPISISHEKISY